MTNETESAVTLEEAALWLNDRCEGPIVQLELDANPDFVGNPFDELSGGELVFECLGVLAHSSFVTTAHKPEQWKRLYEENFALYHFGCPETNFVFNLATVKPGDIHLGKVDSSEYLKFPICEHLLLRVIHPPTLELPERELPDEDSPPEE